MLTRCPQCATTFRVTPEQLRARQGRVRCGSCQRVFNALDTLVDAVPPPPRPAPAETALAESTLAAPEIAAPTADSSSDARPAVAAEFIEPVVAESPTNAPLHIEPPLADVTPSRPRPAEPAWLEAASATLSPSVGEAVAESVVPALGESSLVAAPAGDVQDFAAELEPLPDEEIRRRTWPWTLGALAALLGIASQTALHFRTEIALAYPDAKPALAAACVALGCALALPRQAELIGIEASDLSPDAEGKLTVSATLKNRAPFAQEYPALELTLTDTADRALVRRVLAPAEYLPPQTPLADGFGANAELIVNLLVETPGLSAAGYRLYLFYP